MQQSFDRRPLKTRARSWAKLLALMLLRTGITPNTVSILSLFFAALGALGLLLGGKSGDLGPLIVAVFGIQLRLLCNMMDGMLATEGGRGDRLGALYNELPDRLSDVLIIVAAGYGYSNEVIGPMSAPALGWFGALLAVSTAYVRAFGAALGCGECYLGPMAKPHRMALLTALILVEILSLLLGARIVAVPLGLLLICLGCVVTIVRRVRYLVLRMP